jgi:hypothetical protein
MTRIEFIIIVSIFTFIGCAIYLTQKNKWLFFAERTSADLVYIKDSRVDICFAISIKYLASVPCDKVGHLIK